MSQQELDVIAKHAAPILRIIEGLTLLEVSQVLSSVILTVAAQDVPPQHRLGFIGTICQWSIDGLNGRGAFRMPIPKDN